MSHELLINSETNEASIIYVGDKPWHGYGFKWDNATPLTAVKAMEVIGSDFPVEMTVNLSVRPDGEAVAVGSSTIWRPPILKYGIADYLELGTVSPDYVLLQTREIAEMLDEPVEVAGEMKAITDIWPVLTHGVIKSGTRMFYSLDGGMFGIREPRGKRTEDVKRVVSLLDDKRGKGAFFVTVGGIVIVCWNTWQMNLASADISAKLVHRGDIKGEIRDLLSMIREVQLTLARQDDECNRMAATKLTDEEVGKLVLGTYPAPRPQRAVAIATKNKSLADAIKATENKRALAAMTAYQSERDRVEVYRNGVLTEWEKFNDDTRRIGRGTAWGYFNAVTAYVDHAQTIKGSDESRALYKAFGDGSDVKSRAYDLCVAASKN